MTKFQPMVLMKGYTTSELSHLIDELRFKGFLK